MLSLSCFSLSMRDVYYTKLIPKISFLTMKT